jgi:trehalose 6-phosphate phosphatase
MVTDTSKATAMRRFCQLHGVTRLAFVGDDLTDEEVFRAAASHDITVRVGGGPTDAAYRLADPAAVLTLLVGMADLVT